MSSNDADAPFVPSSITSPAVDTGADRGAWTINDSTTTDWGRASWDAADATATQWSATGSTDTGPTDTGPTGIMSAVSRASRAAAVEVSTRARAALIECATELGTDELTLMADSELLTLARQLEDSSRFIDALLIRVAGTIDERSAPAIEDSLAKKAGCRNSIELLQRLSQRSATALSRRLRVARATRADVGISGSPVPPKFPALAAALSEGRLPEESAHQIIKALRALPSHVDPEHILIAERSIVAQAAGYPMDDGQELADQEDPTQEDPAGDENNIPLPLDSDTVRLICERWCAYLDQDGSEPSDEEALANRYFRLGREKNGLVPAHGLLTPDTAALIGNLFSAINSPLTATNADDPTGSGTTGANSGSPTRSNVCFVDAEAVEANTVDTDAVEDTTLREVSDKRSHGQKVHDALRILAETAARASETPQLGGAPVTVLIQTTQEDLANSLQQNLDRLSEEAAVWSTPGTAWLHGHDGLPSPVSMSVALHGICTGATQRVITGPMGEILGIESPTRTFTPHQRRAIMARDGGCIIPGCTVPAVWCEVHHVIEWAQGGPTSTDNGVLLCWYHHRNIDSNDWHIRMVEGLPEVLAPPWVDPHQRWRKTRPPLRMNTARQRSARGRATAA